MLNQIHHIAFLVRDLDATIARFERMLDMPVFERGPVLGRGGEVAIFKLNNINLELVSPTDKNGFLQRLLDTQGEGFFHMAFGVDDLDAACRELGERGFKPSGPPKVVYKDWRIVYLDKADTGGIYTHLIPKDAQ